MSYHTTGSIGNNMFSPGVYGYHNPGLSYPDGENIPEALPDGYQLGFIDDHVNNACGNCYFNQNNFCYKWIAPVRHNYWCAAWYQQEIYTVEPQIPNLPPSYPPVESLPLEVPLGWMPPMEGGEADPIFSDDGQWVYKLNTDVNPEIYEWVPAGPLSGGGEEDGLASRFVAANLVAEDLSDTDPAGNLFHWTETLEIFLDSGLPDLSNEYWMVDRTINAEWRTTRIHPFHFPGEWELQGLDYDGDGFVDIPPEGESIYPAPGTQQSITDKRQIREAVHDKIVRLFATQGITKEQLLASQKTIKSGKLVQSRTEGERLVLFQKDANLYNSDVTENFLINKLVNYLFLQYYRLGAVDIESLTNTFSMQVSNLDGLGKKYILNTGLTSTAPISSFIVGEEGGPDTEPGTVLNALNIGQLIQTDNDFTYDKEKAAEVLDIQIDELLPRSNRRQDLIDDFFRLYLQLRPPEYPNYQDTNNDGKTDFISQEDFVNFGLEYNISNKDNIENFNAGNKFITWLQEQEHSNKLNKSLEYLYKDLHGFFKEQELDLSEEMEDGRPEYQDVSSGYLKLRSLNQGLIIRKQEGTDIGFVGLDAENPLWRTSGLSISQWIKFLNKDQDGTLLNYGNPLGKTQPKGFQVDTYLIRKEQTITLNAGTLTAPMGEFYEQLNASDNTNAGLGAFEPNAVVTYGQLAEQMGLDTFAEYDRARFVRMVVRWDQNYFDNSMPLQGTNITSPLPRFDITTTATAADQQINYIRKTPTISNENAIFLLTYTQVPIDFNEWYFFCCSYDPVNVTQQNYANVYNNPFAKDTAYWLNHINDNGGFTAQSGVGNVCNIEYISKSRLLRARGYKTDNSLIP